MGGYLVLFVLAVVAGLSFVSWFAIPKGNQQTLVRTMIVLSLWCTFLMWSITYLAQLHPLIAPKRSDLRFEDARHGERLAMK